MDQDELIQKLDQIEEQAQFTLAEFPKTLTKERQRMIIALVRYIRSLSTIRIVRVFGAKAERRYECDAATQRISAVRL